jgi:hypothetical protein
MPNRPRRQRTNVFMFDMCPLLVRERALVTYGIARWRMTGDVPVSRRTQYSRVWAVDARFLSGRMPGRPNFRLAAYGRLKGTRAETVAEIRSMTVTD